MTLKQFRDKYGVFISTRLSGKMTGIPALSTSALCNKYCRRRAADPDMVCAHCYSIAVLTSGRRPEAVKAYENNSRILSREIIPIREWPIINAQYFRLESHGDLINDIHFINFIHFAKRNEKTGCRFVLWTKNPGIISRVLNDGYKKPRNMIIVCSSPFLNRPVNMENYINQYPFIDKFFTVYDRETAAAENININCGARSCLDCGRCYSKRTGKTVNELLKK